MSGIDVAIVIVSYKFAGLAIDVGARRLEILVLHACLPVKRLYRMVEACQPAAVRQWFQLELVGVSRLFPGHV